MLRGMAHACVAMTQPRHAFGADDCAVQEPAAAELSHVMEVLKDKYSILIGKGGLHGNVFRIKPPMCFTAADAECLLACMGEALSAL
jgi:4-aminobutyrate aminotransferase-like enzyme